ncbi:phosphoglucosamine mutase, partial [Candidatus Dependentiae bacterium]|nr:phosphoglucosamine mutase [Candidatus Dependentiae bacterium]
GADLRALHTQPDGYNINRNCGATHLESLQSAVIEHNAFMGIAFDGDGDRCMGVNSSGKIVDGDALMALLLTHPDYTEVPTVVSTVMANQGLEMYLASQGKKLIRTSVGDKYVVEALIKHALPLGGEPSGHIILRPFSSTGDGILIALKVLETMLITGNYSCTTFAVYPQVCINLTVKEKKDLTQAPLADAISASTSRLTTGRLLVRYSGTEPLLRIMVEDEDEALCSSVATTLAQQLHPLLSS